MGLDLEHRNWKPLLFSVLLLASLSSSNLAIADRGKSTRNTDLTHSEDGDSSFQTIAGLLEKLCALHSNIRSGCKNGANSTTSEENTCVDSDLQKFIDATEEEVQMYSIPPADYRQNTVVLI